MKKVIAISSMLLGVVFLTGCNKANEIQIKEEKTYFICNLLSNEECIVKYNIAKDNPIEIINDTVKITAETACGIEFKTKSIKSKKDKIIITLIEKGKDIAKCGSEMQIIEIKTDKPITLDKLEVYQYSEFSGETEKIYPTKR